MALHAVKMNPAISEVLPYDGRMLLLDELLGCGAEHVSAALTIRPDSLLSDGRVGVPAWVGIEYMAQTVCAYSGCDDLQAGRRPGIGLLLGSRAYRSSVPMFAIGSRLVVNAVLLMRDESDLVAFRCEILADGQRVAEGDIKAIRPADVRTLIGEQSRV